MSVIQQIIEHSPDARPVQNSASFQGLSVTVLAPVIIPLIASWFGLSETDATMVFTHVVAGAGALWSLYGILRRCDIRMPWQKAD